MTQTCFSIASFESLLGPVNLAASERGILSLDFFSTRGDFSANIAHKFGRTIRLVDAKPSCFESLFTDLDGYFSGEANSFDVKLDLAGSSFDLVVWDALRTIPFGSVVTYAELASFVGSPHGARAVGSACARNPVPLIVPCHRVVSSGGRIGGYSAGASGRGLGGVELKRALLSLEGVTI